MRDKNLFSFFLLVFFITSSHAKITIKDDAGQLISLDKPAHRVISLSPAVTELIYAAGGGNNIVAAVSYSDYPKQAKKLPRVGSYDALDIEQILQFKPDIIIAWNSGNSASQIKQLKKLGLKVYLSEPNEFNDIAETIIKFGKLMGSEQEAKISADNFVKQFNSLKRQFPPIASEDKQTTFIQIWNNPLMSINSQHLISKVVSFCGGKNIFSSAKFFSNTTMFSNTKSLTYSPDIESILKYNPEIIIATGMAENSKIWLKRWQQWHFLSAVKNHRLYSVNPDHLVRQTPRILLGIKEVCQLIYPHNKKD